MIEFSDCDVIINGTGLVADSASISERNSIKPAYGIGHFRSVMLPDGPKTSEIQINYILNPLRETNLQIINDIKSNPPIINPVNIEIAGLRCSGYITSFSFSLSPSEKIVASVSYISYHDLVGQISKKRGTVFYDTNPISAGHGWSSVVNSGDGNFAKTYNLSYDCSIDYQPFYSFGSTTPNQVLFIGGKESAKVTKEDFTSVNFSGQSGAYQVFSSSGESILLYNLNKEMDADTPSLKIDLRSATVSTSRLSARVDDYIQTEISLEREF